MLRGNHLATVDEKGRVKIPADFVDELCKGSRKFYVTSAKGDSARVYPMKEWEAIEKKLAKRSSYEPAKRKFLERTNYYGQVVELDGQGRILIPPVLRDAAEMKGEVDIQGQLTFLEIWNHARFLERLNSNPVTADDEKAFGEMGI
jgi:MraZ protein